jgi:hypothetical protein
MFVLLATFKFCYQKVIKVRWWELSWWIITFIFLFISGVFYFINLFNQGAIINYISLLILATVFLFIIIWYYSYYLPIYHHRKMKNPKLQEELDSFFKPLSEENYNDK